MQTLRARSARNDSQTERDGDGPCRGHDDGSNKRAFP